MVRLSTSLLAALGLVADRTLAALPDVDVDDYGSFLSLSFFRRILLSSLPLYHLMSRYPDVYTIHARL